MTLKRLLLGGVGLAIVVATFVFLLPTIADYGDVWAVVTELSWPWLAALAAVTALNLATFAPPWVVALPGLRYFRALELTQASAALSMVVPGGVAGMGVSWGMARGWGFGRREITRAITLVSLWSQFLNLAVPDRRRLPPYSGRSGDGAARDGSVRRRGGARRRRDRLRARAR